MFQPKNLVSFQSIDIGNKIIVCDPVAEIGYEYAPVIENVLPGEYALSEQRYNDNHPDSLMYDTYIANIYIENVKYFDLKAEEIVPTPVGIVNRACGIFDFDYFKEKSESPDHEKWAKECILMTRERIKNERYKPFDEYFDPQKVIDAGGDVEEERAFSIDMWRNNKFISREYLDNVKSRVIDRKGVVSSTGFGNNAYTVLVGRDDDGMVASIRVMFIMNDEEKERFRVR